MREITTGLVNGVLRPKLNGQFVFQVGTLDQGFWPDGLYTAPTDAALAFDLQKHKDLGFNMVRKHIKVEPQRWFYHADRLGLLVWQDIPSLTAQDINPTDAQQAQFEAEAREIVDEHRSSPAVSRTRRYNEGWGERSLADTRRVAQNIKTQDPTRLVNPHSGHNCCQSLGDPGNGDIDDWHVYLGPDSPVPSSSRIAVLGEFGGLGLHTPGHEYSPSGSFFAYEWQSSSSALTDRYVGLVQGTPEPDARQGAQRLGLHRDHRPGGRAERLPDLRPAGDQDGPGPGPRRQHRPDQRLEDHRQLGAGGPAASTPAGRCR